MSHQLEWSIVFYLDANGNSPVEEFLDSLDRKALAQIDWAIEQLRIRNVQAREPFVKHLDGKLWELRRESGGNAYRILYFFFTGRKIVFVNAFQKKTPKIPQDEIKIAQARMERFLQQNKKGSER